MRGRIAVAGVFAALAAAPPAVAAPADVRAVDSAVEDQNRWEPADVSVNIGEAVTWRFDTVGAHNVKSTTPNWTMSTSNLHSGATASFTFTAEGIYRFRCDLHSNMFGSVTVGNPPPPPPPPLSEQEFANDQPAPTVFEVTDEQRPRLTRVRAAGLDGAARVRFRLDEPGRVTVRLKRGSRTVRQQALTLRRAGRGIVTLRDLAAGTYRVEVRARDLARNRARLKRAQVTVR